MWQKPHREFEREARLLSKIKQWFEQPKGDPAMFPLSRTCVKIAAAGALIVLAASATLANEMIQKSGPVGPHEPILVTVGQKHVIAFFVPGNGQCNVQAVIWNADDPEAKSAARIRVNLSPRQTTSIDTSATETFTLKCGEFAESLSAIDTDRQVALR